MIDPSEQEFEHEIEKNNVKFRRDVRAWYQNYLKEWDARVSAAALEGREEGRREGARDSLSRLLVEKFGKPSADVTKRLDAATLAELEMWGSRLFTATSAREVFVTSISKS